MSERNGEGAGETGQADDLFLAREDVVGFDVSGEERLVKVYVALIASDDFAHFQYTILVELY